MIMLIKTLAAVAAGTVLATNAFAQSTTEVRSASPYVAIEIGMSQGAGSAAARLVGSNEQRAGNTPAHGPATYWRIVLVRE